MLIKCSLNLKLTDYEHYGKLTKLHCSNQILLPNLDSAVVDSFLGCMFLIFDSNIQWRNVFHPSLPNRVSLLCLVNRSGCTINMRSSFLAHQWCLNTKSETLKPYNNRRWSRRSSNCSSNFECPLKSIWCE